MEVTQPGHVMKFSEEGMPKHERSGEFGDLFLTLNVVFPSSLNETQIKRKSF